MATSSSSYEELSNMIVQLRALDEVAKVLSSEENKVNILSMLSSLYWRLMYILQPENIAASSIRDIDYVVYRTGIKYAYSENYYWSSLERSGWGSRDPPRLLMARFDLIYLSLNWQILSQMCRYNARSFSKFAIFAVKFGRSTMSNIYWPGLVWPAFSETRRWRCSKSYPERWTKHNHKLSG